MANTNKHDNAQEKSLDEVRGKLAENKANYKGYNQSQHRDPRQGRWFHIRHHALLHVTPPHRPDRSIQVQVLHLLRRSERLLRGLQLLRQLLLLLLLLPHNVLAPLHDHADRVVLRL